MIGYLAALGASVFICTKDLVSKSLAAKVDGNVSAFASFAFAIPYYLVLLLVLYLFNIETFAFKSHFFYYALFRSISDVGAESLKMLALKHGEISLVTQFLALSPLFLAITSPLITHDVITVKLVVALSLITFSSIMVVYKKSRSSAPTNKKAILFAIGSAVFFSFNSAFDRLAAQEASAPFSAFVMTLFSGLILLPVSLFFSRKTLKKQLVKNQRNFFIRGAFEVIFMTLKMIALQYLQAPVVIIIQRFSVVLTVIGGKILYKEDDFRKRFFASLLIVASGLLILF
jgi:drug/metabolite transporter (DMT)-like permease